MRIAAYCRVSTEKEEQLDSLNKQKEFFEDFARANNYEMYNLYADEGISGKQVKNRKQFLLMMADAKKKKFDKVVVKDVSRFARNTVDLLNNVRELKSLGIPVEFINNGKVLQGDSEFILTIYGAIAQEESANMSKRVKFGKSITAEKGRVPNIVFGYDKMPKEKYILKINEKEAEIVEDIFDKYVNEKWGMKRIAMYLNEMGVRTKRDASLWCQAAVKRIVTNAIYTGRIINKKSEILDFITGQRRKIEKDDWITVQREEMRIIDDELFERAQKIVESRKDCFSSSKRESTKHLFSKLIYCEHCGYSFLRQKRIYTENGPEHIWWTCSGKHTMGKKFCVNPTTIKELELEKAIQEYFEKLIHNKEALKKRVENLYTKIKKQDSSKKKDGEQIQKLIEKLEQKKKKYLEMYADEIISKEELKRYTKPIDDEIIRERKNLEYVQNDMTDMDALDIEVKKFIKTINDLTETKVLTNEVLKRVIDKIMVNNDGQITVKLKLFTENILDENFQLGNVFP